MTDRQRERALLREREGARARVRNDAGRNDACCVSARRLKKRSLCKKNSCERSLLGFAERWRNEGAEHEEGEEGGARW